MRVAAIDCGTNSARLLVADTRSSQGRTELVVCDRSMEAVRLGQGVDREGHINDNALGRLATALDTYRARLDELKPDHVRFVATSATRDAANRDAFMSVVRRHLGVEPQVIDGEEEARLSYAGAVSGIDAASAQNILVVDLGGGSTECVVGRGDNVVSSGSVQMGAVRYTERFLLSDPPTAQERERAERAAREQIDTLAENVDFSGVDRMVGVAGTVATVMAHALDLPGFVHERIDGASIPVAVAEAAATELASFSRSRLASLPYMHPGRVDVIAGGATILATLLQAVEERSQGRVESLIASEKDILDGIALDLADRV